MRCVGTRNGHRRGYEKDCTCDGCRVLYVGHDGCGALPGMPVASGMSETGVIQVKAKKKMHTSDKNMKGHKGMKGMKGGDMKGMKGM